MSDTFQIDQVVRVEFHGTGEVFEPGFHAHSGRVLKRGSVENSWLVRLFSPIRERVNDKWRDTDIIGVSEDLLVRA